MKDYSFLFKGRYNAHDIANFIKESVESNVKVLSPEEFNKIGKNEDKWFVDFYAPVCKNQAVKWIILWDFFRWNVSLD